MMSGTRTQKKLQIKSQRKAIVENFSRGCQYEQLEGQRFLYLSTDNGTEDVLIQDYFRFIHALHPPPEVFRNSFSLRIN